MKIRLPHDKSTRYALYVLVGLLVVWIGDFIRVLFTGGFMSPIGLVALVATGPAMYALAHFLGNHDVKPAVRQRNRDRFINK